jgi:hypothetical protein
VTFGTSIACLTFRYEKFTFGSGLLSIAMLQPAAAQVPHSRGERGSLCRRPSPGSMISIMGSNLRYRGQAPDPQNPFTVLNGVSVKIASVPVGLFTCRRRK